MCVVGCVLIDFADRHVGEPCVVAEVFTVDKAADGDVVSFPAEKDEMEPEFAVIGFEVSVVVPPFGFPVDLRGDYGGFVWQ